MPQREGISALAIDGGVVHHTYSTHDRGVEQRIGTYRTLDPAPLGRNEEGPASWWHRHDEYEPTSLPDLLRRGSVSERIDARVEQQKADQLESPRLR